MPTSSTAAYLYCVLKSARRPSMTRVPPGLPGAAAPEAHPIAPSLWMVATLVPLELYGPAALEPRLRDLDWVSNVALAHEAVIEHFSKKTALVVVPAKLFTMFSSLEKARADVRGRRVSLARAIKHIAGCNEWGLRIFRAVSPAVSSPSTRPSTGAAFLAARKEARDSVIRQRAEAAHAAEAAFRSLARHARDAVQRPARQEAGTNPPVLEAAFLVTAAARAAFKREAARQHQVCASSGLDLSLTGPWPAYNFIGNP